MGRYTGALCRKCRREGMKLYLKGLKCETAKCTIERRNFAPGQHGKNRSKPSEYGIQMREKQRLRRMYGINERQFKLYFIRASKRKGVTGDMLLQMLETRLDNVVYRLCFALGRRDAHQIVQHGHICVNGKKVNIPSYLVKGGDVVSVKEKEGSKKLIAARLELVGSRPLPEWLELDKSKLTGKILRIPERSIISVPVDENKIVELYSK